MRIIAHRGNCNGPNRGTENKPETIMSAIQMGFDCEIDVWKLNERFYLGHDYPETEITQEFFAQYRDRLWIHCKHLESLLALKDDYNCFFHDRDLYTITSKGYIWGNINSPCHSNVIQVMPEKSETFSLNCLGICTDYPLRYARLLK